MMKMRNVKKRLTQAALAIIAVAMPLSVKAQERVETSLDVDLVSNYIWRGQRLGGVSVQPGLSIGYRGLSFGAWGSVGFESSDTREMDLTIGYAKDGFSVSLTDYWFSKTGDGTDAEYFHYKASSAGSSHVFELQAGYNFRVIDFNWYTNIAGADGVTSKGKRAYSSYASLSVPFTLGGLTWTAEIGATPWSNTFYGASGFAVTNISIEATKDIDVTKSFKLPIHAKVTWNPHTEAAYFTAGLTL